MGARLRKGRANRAKKSKYWREFTAPTRAEAEKAAASWWAEQRGFDKISGWTMPANASAPGAAPQRGVALWGAPPQCAKAKLTRAKVGSRMMLSLPTAGQRN
jgi:hypothetical protein